MQLNSKRFAELARRARSGDFQAQEKFREQMEESMVVMVRQALRDGQPATSIARRILSAARRLKAEQGGLVFQTQEEFERDVAHNVCEELMARLHRGGGRLETKESFSQAAQASTLVVH